MSILEKQHKLFGATMVHQNKLCQNSCYFSERFSRLKDHGNAIRTVSLKLSRTCTHMS